MNITSKLPHVGTTIFTLMSAYALEHQAVNLSQGFPDFDCSPELVDLLALAMKKGLNQYAPMSGAQQLREEISRKYVDLYGCQFHPDMEITVTTGGSGAVFAAIAAVVGVEDEVIIFEPAYDLYRPVIELMGAKVRAVTTQGPDFTINWKEVENLISPKTKLMILNNPNNPATTTLKEEDFQEIIRLVQNTDILLLSDEVYEHIVFDGQEFRSIICYPELRERSFLVASFRKLFHITGWKVGYCIAPPGLTKEVRKVHQFNSFCVHTPSQFALAEFLKRKEEYLNLSSFFQQKRDFFMEGLAQTPFKAIQPEGSYFLLADYSQISDLPDTEFALKLTEKHKVATIPVSAFYQNPPKQKLIRFCFAKKQETLEKALENLYKIQGRI